MGGNLRCIEPERLQAGVAPVCKILALGYLAAPPSPTTTKGAQTEGCEAGAQFAGLKVSTMTANVARRTASARPIAGFLACSPTARVTSCTAAALSTAQCDTSSARAPA